MRNLSSRARWIRRAVVGLMAVALVFGFPTWSTLAVFGLLVLAWIGGTCFGFLADDYWLPQKREPLPPLEWGSYRAAKKANPRKWL